MGFLSSLGASVLERIEHGQNPSTVYDGASGLTGFLSAPTSPAPDSTALVETDQISATIARCINVISDDASQVPLQLLDVSGRKPVEVFDHPAIQLFRHINPVEWPTLWLSHVFADLLTEGNHFSFVDRDTDGTPIGLVRLPPHRVFVVSHPTKIIGGYLWKTDTGKHERYDASQVFHIRTRNPDSIYRGLGYLVRLRQQILLDRAMRAWNLQRFRNGIPATLVLTIKKQFATEKAFQKYARRQWESMAGVQNTGKPLILRDGITEVTPLERPNESELGFLASMKYTRNEIAMLFGIPPSRLSDFGEAFRANATEQSTFYTLDTLMTWHRTFIDFLNFAFIPKFFPDMVASARAGQRAMRFAFDYSQVRSLAKSEREIAETWKTRIDSMQATPDEARAATGRPLHGSPEAQELFHNGKQITDITGTRPNNSTPQEPQQPEEPDDTEDEATDEEANRFRDLIPVEDLEGARMQGRRIRDTVAV